MISGTMMWPGSEVEWSNGQRQTYGQAFSSDVGIDEKVERIFKWLDSGYPPSLVTLYFPEVDAEGHSKGKHGVHDSVKLVDDGLAKLVAGITDRKLEAITDIIVVSDHGMAFPNLF